MPAMDSGAEGISQDLDGHACVRIITPGIMESADGTIADLHQPKYQAGSGL